MGLLSSVAHFVDSSRQKVEYKMYSDVHKWWAKQNLVTFFVK